MKKALQDSVSYYADLGMYMPERFELVMANQQLIYIKNEAGEGYVTIGRPQTIATYKNGHWTYL